jgi:hypothetical protein
MARPRSRRARLGNVSLGQTPRTLTRAQLLKAAAQEGWQRIGWRRATRQALAEMLRRHRQLRRYGEEANAILECLADFRARPFAWRLKVEGKAEDWGHPVLVVEFLEMNVTKAKLTEHTRLWWGLDASELMHLRTFLLDKTGRISPLVTDETIYDLLRDEAKRR